MKRDWTTVNISNKHDHILNKICDKTRRDKKAQLELLIEKEGLTQNV